MDGRFALAIDLDCQLRIHFQPDIFQFTRHGVHAQLQRFVLTLRQDARHVVRNHHNAELMSVDLTTVVHVADLIVLQMGLGLGLEGLNYPIWRGAVKRINLQTQDLDRVRLMLIAELRRATDLLKLPEHDGR